MVLRKPHKRAAIYVIASLLVVGLVGAASASRIGSGRVAPEIAAPAETLKVTELGIQLPLTIPGLRYYIKGANGAPAAHFTTGDLILGGGAECTAAADGPLGSIDMITPTPPEETLIKTIAGRDLNYLPAQVLCSQKTSVRMLISQQQAQFITSLKRAGSIK